MWRGISSSDDQHQHGTANRCWNKCSYEWDSNSITEEADSFWNTVREMFIPVSIRWDRCLWKTLIPVRDMQLCWTAICGKRSFHREGIARRLWKMFIPPGRCYCGKRSFHRDGIVVVENVHSTDNHSQGVCRKRSFYWETRVQDRYFIPTIEFRMDYVWRPTRNLTFKDIVWHCLSNIFDMHDDLTLL